MALVSGKKGAVLVSLIGLVFLLRGISAPGITWDEAIYIPAGANYVGWFEEIISFGRNPFSAEQIRYYWKLNWEHPPLAKYFIAAAMYTFQGILEPVAAARVSSAFLLAGAIFVTCLTADKLYGAPSGIFAGAFLLFMPRVFGHGRLAALDMSLTFAWTLTTYLYLDINTRLKPVMVKSLALSAALLSKLNGVILPFLLVLWTLAYKKKNTLKIVFFTTIIAGALVYIFWPWLWHSPARKITGYIHFHFFRGYRVPVFYLGKIYSDGPAPFHYPLLMSLFTLPPAVVLLAGYKFACSAFKKFKDPFDGLIILNAAVPAAVLCFPFVGKYDGIRLFLPAFPFIAVMAGAGLWELIQKYKKKFNNKIILPAVLIFFSAALPVLRMGSHHLSYYNFFTGGISGARGLGLETTYWGDSVTEDVLSYINENAADKAGVVFYPVGSNVVRLLKLTGRLRNDLTGLGLEKIDEADFLVLVHRQGMFTEKLKKIIEEEKPEFSNGWGKVRFTSVYKLSEK